MNYTAPLSEDILDKRIGQEIRMKPDNKVIIGSMSFSEYICLRKVLVHHNCNMCFIRNGKLPDTYKGGDINKFFDGILVCDKNEVELAKKCIDIFVNLTYEQLGMKPNKKFNRPYSIKLFDDIRIFDLCLVYMKTAPKSFLKSETRWIEKENINSELILHIYTR